MNAYKFSRQSLLRILHSNLNSSLGFNHTYILAFKTHASEYSKMSIPSMRMCTIVPDRRKVWCKRFQPILEKCAVVFNMLCKKNQCIVKTYPVWTMWSRNLTPSTQGSGPPSLISIGEGCLLITFAGCWLLISFLTRGAQPPSLICLATGDLVY